MSKLVTIFMLISILGLAACSAGGTEAPAETTTTNTNTAVSQPDSESTDTTAATLSEDYEDALSVTGQLAIGMMQLEETENAVDEVQAAELLPLWRALQSLSESDTTAVVELTAVLHQIQANMTPEQIAAIGDMALTSDSLTELQGSGTLFPGGQRQREGEGTGGFAGGGFPGGGIPGGGIPGGGLPGGGPGAGGVIDEDALATRQAQFASGDFEEQLLIRFATRWLEAKTGEAPANARGNIANTVYAAASETTGLPEDEIRALVNEGQSLTAIIEANGGDVAAVREAVVAALSALPNAADLNVEEIADQWLGE